MSLCSFLVESLQGLYVLVSFNKSIDDFNIIDKEPSQVTREAKEAIHIRRLDPSLNRNIGKMSIPQCFDNLLGAKPKHPRIGELSAAPLPVEEVAPPLQIPGLNLTQFNNIGNFRPNVAIHVMFWPIIVVNSNRSIYSSYLVEL